MAAMMGGGNGKAARAEKKEARKDLKETRQLIKTVAPKGLNKAVKEARKERLKAEKADNKVAKRASTIGVTDMMTRGIGNVKNPLVGPMKQAVKKRKY